MKSLMMIIVEIVDLIVDVEPIDEGPTNPPKQKEIYNFSKFFLLLLSNPREDLRADEHVARVCGLSDVSASDCPSTLGSSGSVPSNVQIRGRNLVNQTRNLGRINEPADSTQLLSIEPDLLVYLMIGENGLIHTDSRTGLMID